MKLLKKLIAAALLPTFLTQGQEPYTYKPNGTIPVAGTLDADLWESLPIEVRMADRMQAVRDRSEPQLIAAAANPAEEKYTRMACAILLFREHQSPAAREAALSAFHLKNEIMPWEQTWRRHYPVAAAVIERPELLEIIAQKGIKEESSYDPAHWILLDLQQQGKNNIPLLERLLNEATTDEERRRGQSMLAATKGKYLRYDPPPPAAGSGSAAQLSAPAAIPVPTPGSSAPRWLWIAGGAALALTLLATAIRRTRKSRSVSLPE